MAADADADVRARSMRTEVRVLNCERKSPDWVAIQCIGRAEARLRVYPGAQSRNSPVIRRTVASTQPRHPRIRSVHAAFLTCRHRDPGALSASTLISSRGRLVWAGPLSPQAVGFRCPAENPYASGGTIESSTVRAATRSADEQHRLEIRDALADPRPTGRSSGGVWLSQ